METPFIEIENLGYEYTAELEQIISLQRELLEFLTLRFNNIESGLQILLYIGVAFLFWKVITVIYNLLAGVFLGGL